jgi:hypothetical protein
MKVRLQDTAYSGWLKQDHEYIVLSIESTGDGARYRIEADNGTPVLFDIAHFTITEPGVDPDWIAESYAGGRLDLVPREWSATGFWEAYFDGVDDAIAQYQRARTRMLSRSAT